MATNFLSTDDFPTFTGQESPKEQISALCDYLFNMSQQLQYVLNNLSANNWNSTALQKLTTEIRSGMVSEKAVKQADAGWTIGESGKDLNLVGNIYINGIPFTQEAGTNETT